MRKFIALSITGTLVVAALTTATVAAQRLAGPGNGRPGPGVAADRQSRGGPDGFGRFEGGRAAGPGGVPGRNLGLTEEQRTKVQAIVRGSRDKAGPIADELQVARNSLHRELFADAPNDARVKQFTAKVTELQARLADIRISTSAAIAGVLTAEQRERVRAGTGRGPGAGRGGPGRGLGRRPGVVRG